MKVQCELCPKSCVIEPGQSGECRIRVNVDGKLVAVTYGYPCAANIDPVEKKPLFHFLPGTWIYSIATVGCNLHCKNCQNWQISQQNPEDAPPASQLAPEAIPSAAKRAVAIASKMATNSLRCRSVAYTYTEPVVYYEYTLDSCIQVRNAGWRNVLVTAGYINSEPMKRLCQYVDAANIDLKALSDKFYQDICSATLKPVLNTLVLAKSMGVLVEVTNLIIPTLNDSETLIRALCKWVARNLGKETPLHFSRFHPRYQMENLPPTPAATLDRAREIAKEEGLYHVYIGNIQRPDASNTYCHSCGELLVERRGYWVLKYKLQTGKCPACKTEIHGIWH